MPFICSSDGANEFCEASLPCGIAKARKREAKFSCNCCILLSLVLFQSQLHRVPGAGRSSQLRQSTLCWSCRPHSCFLRSKKMPTSTQAAKVPGTGPLHRQTRTCRSLHLLSSVSSALSLKDNLQY